MQRFAKYHGLGNDFVLLDRTGGGEPVTASQAIAWCDRRRGIGADGVLTLLPSELADARMHVTNADGSVAEMCGNGLRCVAKHVGDEARSAGDALRIETDAGVRECLLHRGSDGRVAEVTVDMGAPELDARRIPMARDGRFVRGELEAAGRLVSGTAVSMGNPHIVLFGHDAMSAAVLGPALEHHEAFPARANVGFARVEGEGLELLVWERGCGFTGACGTGACAAMVAAVLEDRLPAGEERPVRLAGGVLHVRVLADLSRVFMRGPAVFVYRGEAAL